MKDYGQYSFEAFITDAYFTEWVLGASRSHDDFWNQFIQDYPERASIVLAAKDFLLEIHEVETLTIPPDSFQKNWTQIKNKTGIQSRTNTTQLPTNKTTIRRFLVAASLIGCLLMLGITFFQQQPSTDLTNNKSLPTSDIQWLELKNTTAIAKTLMLEDGSKVTLESFSSLKYPSQFIKKQREVVLKGEAFFEIARDTSKPFVVYANETITKVLGTSFSIKAFEGEKEVEVAVKTGKVAVYANVNSLPKRIIKEKEKFVIRANEEQIIIPIPNKKLEVTPNQRVIFNKVKADMHKSVAKLPLPIKPAKQLPKFRFNEEPLSEVLKALGEAYHLELKFEEKDLAKCPITTTIEDGSLFEKLNIICRAMGLTYQEKEAVIYIYGQCE